MSNSIWYNKNEKPMMHTDIVLCGDGWSMPIGIVPETVNTICWENVAKWCYLDELIAQADKAERLQKIAERQNDILQDHFATLGYSIGKEVMDMYDEINN